MHDPFGQSERGTPHTSPLGPPQQPDEIGRVGRYRVLRELGRGGMGIVYLAEDSNLRRKVAVKCLLPEVASRPGNRDRFEREARAMAKVEHENIIPIFDIGEDRGYPYLVMPLLHGETLSDRLGRDERLSLPEVIRLGREMARGLAALHAAGHVHRDVKPGNVWLEAGTGRVKILDFGLARPDDGSDAVSLSGQVMGTPGYMAPEQVTGDRLDYRADLFSLGCILYEAATGRQAFEGPNVLALLANLALQAPAPPESLNPDLPPELSALILALIEKQPDRRPTTSLDVLDRLARISPPPTTPAEAAPAPSPDRGNAANLSAAATVASGIRVRPVSQSPTEPDPPLLSRMEANPPRKIPGQVWTALGGALLVLVVIVIVAMQGDGGTQSTTTATSQTSDQEYRTALVQLRADPKAAATLLRAAAEKGHPAAQYQYARLLLHGLNAVTVDRRLAVEFVRKSAEQDYAPATALLGHLISQEGEGASTQQKAEEWFLKALATLPALADEGNTEAQYALGLLHLWPGGRQDYREAVTWLRKAADAGHEDALYRLGHALDYGIGIKTNPVEAVRRYAAAADRGHVLAACTLGLLECEGWGGPRNTAKGLARLKATASDMRLLAEAGDPEAEIQLGVMASEGRGTTQDNAEAVRWFTLAAERGNPVAANRLAGCHASSRGVAKDENEAARLYLVAADWGLPVAQYNLGNAYERGLGLDENPTEAARWYQKAAEADFAHAQLSLGMLYQKGNGVLPNPTEADRWFERAAANYRAAAEAGDVGSQFRLGQLYERNLGVSMDATEAAKWYRKAADQGHEGAKTALEELK